MVRASALHAEGQRFESSPAQFKTGMMMQNHEREKEELTEKFITVKELMQQGKIIFKQDSKVIDSLLRVRLGPDGKADPSTVDSLARAFANGIMASRYYEELRKIPLKEVQSKYFEMVENLFGDYYHEMKRHGLDQHQFASWVSSKEVFVKEFSEKMESLNTSITEFWEAFGPVVEIHIQELEGLKCVFGGDIFPSYRKNIISSAGLYMDTIVLPDPLLQISSMFSSARPDKSLYYFTKHALSVLSLKKVALADVNPPITVICPNFSRFDKKTSEFLFSLVKQDLIAHTEKAFGVHFKNEQHLDKFLNAIKDIETLKKSLKDSERLLIDTDWNELPLEEQWRKAEEELKMLKSDQMPMSLGQKIKFTTIGRMGQVNEIIVKSKKLNGTPIIQAPTSWQYFLWKYEYDQERSREAYPELKNIFLANALNHEKLLWLGNVPKEALVKLRQENALGELRGLLSKGIREIEKADENSYRQIVDDVTRNISNALDTHKNELNKISSSTKKFFGFDVTPWVVTGGISIAAASSGNVPLSLIATALNLIGFPSGTGKELWTKGRKLLEERSKIQRSPVGILLRAKEK